MCLRCWTKMLALQSCFWSETWNSTPPHPLTLKQNSYWEIMYYVRIVLYEDCGFWTGLTLFCSLDKKACVGSPHFSVGHPVFLYVAATAAVRPAHVSSLPSSGPPSLMSARSRIWSRQTSRKSRTARTAGRWGSASLVYLHALVVRQIVWCPRFVLYEGVLFMGGGVIRLLLCVWLFGVLWPANQCVTACVSLCVCG